MAKNQINENTEEEILTTENNQNDNNELDRIIKFNKPFRFEGKEYTEVDLTKIDDLCAEDIKYIDKQFQRTGLISSLKELTIPYAVIVAAKSSNKPIEFFNRLPLCEAMKIKNLVADVFFQEG